MLVSRINNPILPISLNVCVCLSLKAGSYGFRDLCLLHAKIGLCTQIRAAPLTDSNNWSDSPELSESET